MSNRNRSRRLNTHRSRIRCDTNKYLYDDSSDNVLSGIHKTGSSCKTVNELRSISKKLDTKGHTENGKHKKGYPLYKLSVNNCGSGGRVSRIMGRACPNRRGEHTNFLQRKYNEYKSICDIAESEINKCDGKSEKLRENAREHINTCTSLRRAFQKKLYKPNGSISRTGNYMGHNDAISLMNNLYKEKCGSAKLVPIPNPELNSKYAKKEKHGRKLTKALNRKSQAGRKLLDIFKSEGEKYALSVSNLSINNGNNGNNTLVKGRKYKSNKPNKYKNYRPIPSRTSRKRSRRINKKIQ